jgi:adenine deaminase
MRTADFIRALPKAELHLHLEGAVPWPMARAQAPQLPERPAWLAEEFRFDDFLQFRGAVRDCMNYLVDAPAYGAAAGAIFQGLRAQNVRYAEISFDVARALEQNLPIADVVAAIKGAEPPGLITRVFAALSQHKPERTPPAVIEAVLSAPGLDGLSLHGDETTQGTPVFVDAFSEARRRGLQTKAHAGELMGPASVTTVLDLLGVTRVEHGVRAAEDDAVVERLVAEKITLDVCPWSNVRLRVVKSLATHPIRRLHQGGVRLTINTDDPTVFGRSLSEELISLVNDLGFTVADLAQFQANAFAVAAIPPATQAALLAELNALPTS